MWVLLHTYGEYFTDVTENIMALRNPPKIPDLNGAIFASCNQPFAFAMEAHSSDIGVVPLKRDQLEDKYQDATERTNGWAIDYRSRGAACDLIDVDFLVDSCSEQSLADRGIERGLLN